MGCWVFGEKTGPLKMLFPLRGATSKPLDHEIAQPWRMGLKKGKQQKTLKKGKFRRTVTP